MAQACARPDVGESDDNRRVQSFVVAVVVVVVVVAVAVAVAIVVAWLVYPVS